MIHSLVISLVAILPGYADAPAFEYPIFLTIGADGAVFVSDQDIPCIVKIPPSGKPATVYQGSKVYRTVLNRPRGITADGQGNLFVCDPATMDVYKVTPDGKAEGLTGKPITELNKKPGVRGAFIQPEGIAVAADGTVYVADLRLKTIFALKSGSKTPAKVAAVDAPHGMAIDSDGSLVVVSHGVSHLVRVDPKDGKVTNILKGRLPGKIGAFPLSVAIAKDGSYILTDNYNRCLWRVTKDGKAEEYFKDEQLLKVTGVAVASDGRIAIADPASKCVYWLSPDKKLTKAGGK